MYGGYWEGLRLKFKEFNNWNSEIACWKIVLWLLWQWIIILYYLNSLEHNLIYFEESQLFRYLSNWNCAKLLVLGFFHGIKSLCIVIVKAFDSNLVWYLENCRFESSHFLICHFSTSLHTLVWDEDKIGALDTIGSRIQSETLKFS